MYFSILAKYMSTVGETMQINLCDIRSHKIIGVWICSLPVICISTHLSTTFSSPFPNAHIHILRFQLKNYYLWGWGDGSISQVLIIPAWGTRVWIPRTHIKIGRVWQPTCNPSRHETYIGNHQKSLASHTSPNSKFWVQETPTWIYKAGSNQGRHPNVNLRPLHTLAHKGIHTHTYAKKQIHRCTHICKTLLFSWFSGHVISLC